jgi:hypothetical protein
MAAFRAEVCSTRQVFFTFETVRQSTPFLTEPGCQVFITCPVKPESNHLQIGLGAKEVVNRLE